jgi:hypothetical protein
MTAIQARVSYRPSPVAKPLVSPEIATILESHGIPTEGYVEVFDCPEAVEALQRLPASMRVRAHDDVEALLGPVRRRELSVVFGHARSVGTVLSRLQQDGLILGVLVYDPEGHDSNSAALRARGVMDVLTDLDSETLTPVIRRSLDFRALLLLELDHRCEAKRLVQRELELLGEPPDQLSDDLDVFQPPPLPVGPLSTYNLEEASESFEAAYIGRVQQLCSSAREAAQVLGVSPAT